MNQRFWTYIGPIRAGAKTVSVYNDGLTVFLYDAANESIIKVANPPILTEGCAEDTLNEPILQTLFQAGSLLIYGQVGDAGIDAEVVIGPPLSESEVMSFRWCFPPECGMLKLPSGQLCIHSYNSLPIGDIENPEDDGGFVDVTPGDYVVTVYAKDFDAMEKLGGPTWEEAENSGEVDLCGSGQGQPLIREVIVLTPVSEAAPLTHNPGVLFQECIS